MKSLVCLYSEGNDTKVAVVSKEKDKFRILRVADLDALNPSGVEAEAFASLSLENTMGDISIGGMDRPQQETQNISDESILSSALMGIKLSDCEFIPALTEPALHYHLYEGSKDGNSGKLTKDIIDDIQKTKNISVPRDNLGYIELAGGSLLSAFADGDIASIELVNALAQINGKRYYKVPAVKSAEISLAYLVSRKKKFFPDDFSLIVYIGKEYSKLIFLQGKKLKHIGATLDVGTVNLHSYDVYFSKILLEMENGGIPRLDNVILCGEDDSENLILSFYGTFPEANVSRIDFDDMDISEVDDDQKEKLSSYSVPIAAAIDYYDDLSGEHSGINLLPRYVKDSQNFLKSNFGWHTYAIVPLLFIVTLAFTYLILINNRHISQLNKEVQRLTILQVKNQKILDEINYNQNKINNFGATQAILDSASKGAELMGKMTNNMCAFVGGRKNMWITSLTVDQNANVTVAGYGLNRAVLTNFADSYEASLLKNISFEKLRSKSTYKFNLNFDLLNLSEKRK
ncbi:MAG: hypothetical protein ACM3SM_06760 [Bacteroidota bacterium]